MRLRNEDTGDLATREIDLPLSRYTRAWRAGRIVALPVTAGVIALLIAYPEPTLGWLWNVVVPLLPATFLLSPAIWRNVCPLATLNELPTRLGRTGRVPRAWAASGVVAALLLVALIPARHAVLNDSGPATALAITGLAAAALALGAVFSSRSGFCNSICPILPVERLYGQHPLIEVGGSRCATCTFCTPRGCVDLARDKAMVQILGRARHSARWLLTPMGAFAAAFPGLIIAYFTHDGTSGLWPPFGRALLLGAASFGAVALIALAARLRGSAALTLIAAVAFGLYYWFAAPGFAAQLGAGDAGRDATRAVAGLLLGAWLIRARRDATRPPGRRRGGGSARRDAGASRTTA